MSNFAELLQMPPDFKGLVRLFPLPDLVMFPRVVQPLHVFEPRYCEMLEEAMASDQLIAMALLQPGWEQDYEGRPPLEPVVCIGRVVSHNALADNRHNLLLLGLARAKVVYELPASAAFRRARVELLPDEVDPAHDALRDELQATLVDLFRQIVPQSDEIGIQLETLLDHDVDLGMLSDVVAFTAELPAPVKQKLLAELNIEARAAALVEALQQALKRPESILPRVQIDWPPKFSAN